jgi:hypothetical protein
MKDQDQVIEIAKLDGKELCGGACGDCDCLLTTDNESLLYLTSRDAIVPVIEKHIRAGNYNHVNTVNAFQTVFGEPCNWQDIICAKPSELCEALLRATGKWKD